jgi:ribosomal-protein-alanine N-acetyltransferase
MEFTLREWKTEDIRNVAEGANNKKIADNLRNAFPHPYTYEDAEWYVNDCIKKGNEHQYTRAIIIDGKAVGSIGVFIGTDVYEKIGELGYWLAEEYWHNGIMPLAVRQICHEVFDKYDIVRIYAEPFEHNTGSRRVLEKAGFTYEGTMRNGVYKNGRIFGYCMYSLLKEEIGQYTKI